MTKHLYKLSITIIICISLIHILSFKEAFATDIISSGTIGDNITWTLDSAGTIRIIGNGILDSYYDQNSSGIKAASKKATNVVIEKGITSIGIRAFNNWNSVTKIVLPEGLQSIGERAFMDCSNLKTVSIPDSVKDIGYACFFRCGSLDNISLPKSLKIISGSTFSKCNSLKTIIVPSNVNSIGTFAFEKCINLTTINIEEGVSDIDDYAFEGCTNLTDITIPKSITRIGARAFSGSGITNITIPESVTQCSYFTEGSSIYEITYLPASIGKNTFAAEIAETSPIKTLILGNNINSINAGAFKEATSLREVVFINNYDYNSKVFDSLSDVAIYRKNSENQLTLEEFSSGTKHVVIPSEVAGYPVSKIGEYTFDSNKYVKTVKLPSGIKSIGPYAFYNCSKLNTINMESGITSIGKFAFYGCNSMQSLKLPNSLKSIGERAFWNCYSLSQLTIPPSVTDIGANAFELCTGLTSITIGETVTKVSEVIMPTVYAGTTKKTTYISIKKNAFSKCKNLKKVVIGAKVKSIGKSAFYNCSSLKNITIKTKKLKSSSVGANAFKGINKKATFKLPKSKYKTYKKLLLKKGATKKMKFKKL